jgi:hypothetical protein
MSRRATFPDEVRVVATQVRLRLLPALVVVLALDHVAAHAVDPLHARSHGVYERSGERGRTDHRERGPGGP